MRPLIRTFALVSAGAALGCSSGPSSGTGPLAYCSATASIAVEVAVTDSTTGASVADAARGVLQSPGTSDSLHFASPPPVLYGGSTLGTFSVIVDHAGYAEWRRDNVVVSQTSECGSVVPVLITAKMVPLP